MRSVIRGQEDEEEPVGDGMKGQPEQEELGECCVLEAT